MAFIQVNPSTPMGCLDGQEKSISEAVHKTRSDRRLIAILMADMVGYSRLVGVDEVDTVQRLSGLFRDVIEPRIQEHTGRVVKRMGDGVLCAFDSIVDALSAALAIQQSLAEAGAAQPEAKRISFRIGINLGDVITNEGDILGEGVNVAARLEALAEPGGICISGSAYQQVKGKLACRFAPLGSKNLKNIAEPVEAWRVVLDGRNAQPGRVQSLGLTGARLAGAMGIALFAALGASLYWALPPPDNTVPKVATDEILALPTGPTVGVLPFTATSAETAAQSFADGITEEIIADLTRFRALHVIARSTMFKYKNREADARDLARDLNLDYLVEGAVRLAAGSARITVELVEPKAARQIWSETYDRPLTAEAVIEVQDEVASKITSAIASASGGAIFSAEWKESLGKPPTELSSYECVLAAHAFFNAGQGYELARECLRETIERDPDYAEAWAMLARIYIEQWYGYAEPYPNEKYDALERAAEAARRAVSLSPDNPRARASLAKVHLMAGDLDNFYAEAQEALRLNPNDPDYLCSLGSWIAYTGRWGEGLALIEKARQLHPAAAAKCGYFATAINHYRKGEYTDALTDFKKSYSGWWVNYMHRAYTYAMLGDQQNAARAVAKLRELVPGFSTAHAIEFHRKYQFEDAVLQKILEGLRRAGVPERSQSS